MPEPVSPYDTYTSSLATRNASPEMLRIWSARHKFNTWRRIWLAVAEAQLEVTRGDRSPLVTKEQVEELRAVVERSGGITDEEIGKAEEFERRLRHDVMAHVHVLGDLCPKARPIIHLGMTSEDVGSNADLMLMEAAERLVSNKVLRCVFALAAIAERYGALASLGLTHYQPAQPVTVGRRFAAWADDLFQQFNRREHGFEHPPFKGLRGATGTQASYLALFGGDPSRVDKLESRVVTRLSDGTGWAFSLSGQTYPRWYDAAVLSRLAVTAAVLHKIATDIRLLCGRKELDEPFGEKQIGSSAMPYKRNPMMCERICGLTRFVMNLVGNAYDTAATQWLERTLDDSSNRRLSLPEAFLALDGALDLMRRVASGLVVHEAMVRKNLMAELPFLATENILMEAVKAGGDRQELHERIRVHAQAAGTRVKQEGLENDLIDRLRGDAAFSSVHHLLTEEHLLDPMRYVGRSVEQTERFMQEVVEPLRAQYAEELEATEDSDRGV